MTAPIEEGEFLVSAARAASERAYCPYSRFAVGAALRTAAGGIFVGCNVENASYGLTICAERAAVAAMVSAVGAVEIEAVGIFTPTPCPTAPCGACRQVLREFGPRAWLVSAGTGPSRLIRPLAELLPDSFGPPDLGHAHK